MLWRCIQRHAHVLSACVMLAGEEPISDSRRDVLATTGKWVEALARWVAILGGIVLTGLAILTGISITGRTLLDFGLRPVPGDFEIVEAGTAFVVCAFLPLTQLRRGHATVTILTDTFGRRANAVIDLMADLLLLATALLITWRHIYGLLDKYAYQETTFILQFPLWWGYAGCLVGMVSWIVIGMWCVWADADALARGERREGGAGAVH